MDIPTLVDKETFTNIFNMVAAKANNSVFVEVGSFLGGSVCYLGERLKEYQKRGTTIYAVDNWNFDNIGCDHTYLVNPNLSNFNNFLNNVKSCGLSDIIIPVIGDSIEKSKSFRENSIDFLFLDGCHEKDYVYEELKAWLPAMKHNSFISGHDYDDNGVKESVDKFFNEYNINVERYGNSYLVQLGDGIV